MIFPKREFIYAADATLPDIYPRINFHPIADGLALMTKLKAQWYKNLMPMANAWKFFVIAAAHTLAMFL